MLGIGVEGMVMDKDFAGDGERERMRGVDTAPGAEADGRRTGTWEAADGARKGMSRLPSSAAPLEATAAFCDPMEYRKTEGCCWLGPINS